MKIFEDIHARLLDTVKAKNHDYSGGADDILSNFRLVEKRIGISTLAGILVRMSDKWERAMNLYGPVARAQVESEKLEDTLMDLAAYCLLAVRAIEDKAIRPEPNK